MEWAKRRPTGDRPGRINLLACTLEDLPGARDALDVAGESPEGYVPLLERIAARYGVAPGSVATAVGCSGANFLALAALVERATKSSSSRRATIPCLLRPRCSARRS